MGRRPIWILVLILAVLWTVFLVNWTVGSAAPGIALSAFPTPEPKPTSPSPGPQPTKPNGGGGGGGGGSRFMNCNSMISGNVTDYGSMAPGSHVLIEVGASGWKSQEPADSNGYFAFKGLCAGKAYVKAVIPPGSLLTNPNAEVELDGKNRVEVDLGFFLPLPQAVSSGGAEATPIPLIISPSVPQVVAPALVQPPVQPPQLVVLPRGVTVDLSAPRTVRIGLDADVSISVQNGGPGTAVDTVIRVPLAAGILLKEADTSRGSLKIQVVPQALGKAGGVAAPLSAVPSELVVDVGTLKPGDVVLIATKVVFKDMNLSGNQTQIQASAVSGSDSFWSNAAVITVEETGGPFFVTLPTTGDDSYDRYFREFLW